MSGQILVMAKAPVPGLVKTRLCPPATPAQAAEVAAAALADTLDTVAATPARRRVLVLAGDPAADPRSANAPHTAQSPEWREAARPLTVAAQRGTGLADRLANAYADTALPGMTSLLVGMDTPQLTPCLLSRALAQLATVDAVLGLAADGGWWALGLRDPQQAAVLRAVPMSTPDTGRLTAAALHGLGLRVAALPQLRDVDTATDARQVAAGLAWQGSRLKRTVATVFPDRTVLPEPVLLEPRP
jgi:uncharacterized protein